MVSTQKIKIELSYEIAISLLNIYQKNGKRGLKEMSVYSCSVTALFTIAKK